MIENKHPRLSVHKQCEMVNVPRSSYYEYIKQSSLQDSMVIERIEKIYRGRPEYGSRRIRSILQRQGLTINRKKVQRLMRSMNIKGVCPKEKPCITTNKPHIKYPFIARDNPIVRIDQVWSTDITYVKTRFGTVYLAAIMDWYSRFIMSWNSSNTMSEDFCIDALQKSLKRGKPAIFNTDQGSQFTGYNFLKVLLDCGIQPSMDGKGRATDNAQIERFWRTIKWEEVYLHEPQTYLELQQSINLFIQFYNHARPHQSLDYSTPSEVHFNLDKKTFDLEGKPIYSEKELEYMAKLY
jgi:putative transposase